MDLRFVYVMLPKNYRSVFEYRNPPKPKGYVYQTLSPKKFKAPLEENMELAHELKIVVYNKSDFAWAEEHAAKVGKQCKLYLQPEWSRIETMTPLIIDR